MSTSYTIRSDVSVLRDTPEHIDFHIKTGDYFAFLATILGFIEETLQTSNAEGKVAMELNAAKEMREDLRYVHQHYRIIPKEEDVAS